MIMTVRHTIAAIKPSDNNDFAWFMVDSGACATRAIEGEFDAPIDETKKKTLYSDSVQGVALKVYGEQTPGIEFDEGLLWNHACDSHGCQWKCFSRWRTFK